MNYQNGNVASTLFSLYDELMVAKSRLETELTHSPGWLENRKKHRKDGDIMELYYICLKDGKRHYQKIEPDLKHEYLSKIESLTNKKAALQYVNEQLELLRKCFNTLKLNSEKCQIKNVVNRSSSPADYQENLRHPTLNGDLVRSKSEALLANLLYFYKVPYEYEKPLTFGHYTIHPDFTITLPTGQKYFWEHLGMIDKPEYAKVWAKKNHTYRQNGISEGNGLIITKDTNGIFDEQDALLKIKSYHLSPLAI